MMNNTSATGQLNALRAQQDKITNRLNTAIRDAGFQVEQTAYTLEVTHAELPNWKQKVSIHASRDRYGSAPAVPKGLEVTYGERYQNHTRVRRYTQLDGIETKIIDNLLVDLALGKASNVARTEAQKRDARVAEVRRQDLKGIVVPPGMQLAGVEQPDGSVKYAASFSTYGDTLSNVKLTAAQARALASLVGEFMQVDNKTVILGKSTVTEDTDFVRMFGHHGWNHVRSGHSTWTLEQAEKIMAENPDVRGFVGEVKLLSYAEFAAIK